ncbi:MAG: hypothetical protein J6D36_02465 [Erysipelotrichaceae bacterium]|nr:hypothetical protein [Erysipelotrichaceae bacterium]
MHMDRTELINELVDICRRQATIIDKLYLEIAKIGAAADMGIEFHLEAKDIATKLEKFRE